MNKMTRKFSVKALLVRNKKILLLKPRLLKGSLEGWDGPGGHVKQSESILEALKREVFEETQLKIREAIPIKLLTIPQNDTDYLIFLCPAPRGKIVLSKEHVAFKWVTVSSLEKMTKTSLRRQLVLIRKVI